MFETKQSNYRSAIAKPTVIEEDRIGFKNNGKNRTATEVCSKLVELFEKDGYLGCILKGQANHCYYPSSLAAYRTCGDVDLWLVPRQKASIKEPIGQVISYLDRYKPFVTFCYLHIGLAPYNGIPIEVHLRPTFLNSPVRNRRLMRYMGEFEECVEQGNTDDNVLLPKLKVKYDAVFQLVHIYRHLLDEGVGLRQVLDYYFLLRAFERAGEDKDSAMEVISSLGMKKIASALMWVIGMAFVPEYKGECESWMLCAPSEKDGLFLLDEIMVAGNFGQYDPRMHKTQGDVYSVSYSVRHAKNRFRHNLRFLSSYPEEVIWEPIARICHFIWKRVRLRGRRFDGKTI